MQYEWWCPVSTLRSRFARSQPSKTLGTWTSQRIGAIAGRRTVGRVRATAPAGHRGDVAATLDASTGTDRSRAAGQGVDQLGNHAAASRSANRGGESTLVELGRGGAGACMAACGPADHRKPGDRGTDGPRMAVVSVWTVPSTSVGQGFDWMRHEPAHRGRLPIPFGQMSGTPARLGARRRPLLPPHLSGVI